MSQIIKTVIVGTALVLGSVIATASCAQREAQDSSAKIPHQDGEALYAFLLKEIPQVISEVPCSCCGESLKWCYEGGCPPS